METSWQVRHITVAQHDGERRWDYAYQFLLQWAMEHEGGLLSSHCHSFTPTVKAWLITAR
jgi:hypothetical protein